MPHLLLRAEVLSVLAYCPHGFISRFNFTASSKDVTYPSTTLTGARLTTEFPLKLQVNLTEKGGSYSLKRWLPQPQEVTLALIRDTLRYAVLYTRRRVSHPPTDEIMVRPRTTDLLLRDLHEPPNFVTPYPLPRAEEVTYPSTTSTGAHLTTKFSLKL